MLTLSLILLTTTPKISPQYKPTGEWVKTEISTYASYFDGRRTASGDIYRHNTEMTAATVRNEQNYRPAVPFGTIVEVQYGDRSIYVKVNDTGSYKPTRAKGWLDLSGKAWKSLFPNTSPSRKIGRYRTVVKVVQ